MWICCVTNERFALHIKAFGIKSNISKVTWYHGLKENIWDPLALFLLLSPATTVPGQPNSTSTKTPAQPAQQAAAPVQAGASPLATTSTPSSATPQGQLPPQTQAHMPIQSPTSLQVKTQGGTAQLQLQQTPQLISVSGLQQQVQVWLAKISTVVLTITTAVVQKTLGKGTHDTRLNCIVQSNCKYQ